MNTFQKFLNLIKSEITSSKLDFDCRELTNEDIVKIVNMAKYHDVLTILAGAFHTNKISVSEEIKRVLNLKVIADINYIEKQKYDFSKISKIFNENKIPFIPLKGFILRNYYQQSYYRTSCDIDIFVHKEDLKAVETLLCNNLNYKLKTRGDHDFSFITDSGVTIEVHYLLYDMHTSENAKEILSKPWNYAINESEYQYKFNDEFFYIYYMQHFKKHFVISGCGIRHIIDIYVMNSKMNICAEQYKTTLEKIGIYTFCTYSEKLSKIWFENQSHDETSLLMEKFILESGVYGSHKKSVAINKSKTKGTIGYFFSRLWINNDELFFMYPKCKKYKILIPFYQAKRWFKMIFDRQNRGRMQRVKMASQTSDKSVEEINTIFSKLELKK